MTLPFCQRCVSATAQLTADLPRGDRCRRQEDDTRGRVTHIPYLPPPFQELEKLVLRCHGWGGSSRPAWGEWAKCKGRRHRGRTRSRHGVGAECCAGGRFGLDCRTARGGPRPVESSNCRCSNALPRHHEGVQRNEPAQCDPRQDQIPADAASALRFGPSGHAAAAAHPRHGSLVGSRHRELPSDPAMRRCLTNPAEDFGIARRGSPCRRLCHLHSRCCCHRRWLYPLSSRVSPSTQSRPCRSLAVITACPSHHTPAGLVSVSCRVVACRAPPAARLSLPVSLSPINTVLDNSRYARLSYRCHCLALVAACLGPLALLQSCVGALSCSIGRLARSCRSPSHSRHVNSIEQHACPSKQSSCTVFVLCRPWPGRDSVSRSPASLVRRLGSVRLTGLPNSPSAPSPRLAPRVAGEPTYGRTDLTVGPPTCPHSQTAPQSC